MKTIMDVTLSPSDAASVTPCELLEDFADATTGWFFLEEDTTHYSELKGVPACIVRRVDAAGVTDYAFAGAQGGPLCALRLLVIDGVGRVLSRQDHHEARDLFVNAFNAYLDDRRTHAALHVADNAPHHEVAAA